MLRNPQEQINYWFPYINQLEKQGVVFDLQNLLNLHPRTLAGFTREEMTEEAIFAVKKAEEFGYIKIVNLKGLVFEYTGKFKEEEEKLVKSRKLDLLKKKSEFWIILVAAIASVVGVIISIYK